MKFTKLLVMLLVVVLLGSVALVACGGGTDEDNGELKYFETDNYKIGYPENWESEIDGKAVTLTSKDDSESEIDIGYSENTNTPYDGMDEDAIFDLMLAGYQGTNAEIVTLNGSKALKIQTGPFEGVVSGSYNIPKGNYFYNVSFSYNDKTESSVDTILRTFEIKNSSENGDELVVEGLSSDVKLSVGDKMPDMEFILHPCSFEMETTFSEYMEENDLKSLVIDFWAIWCEPCKEELPFLEDDYRHYGDKGLGVLAVTIDECGQEEEIQETLEVDGKLTKSFDKLGYPDDWEARMITYDIPVDGDREMAKALGVTSIPRTFLINRDMEILYQHTGFDESKVHALTEAIKKSLGE